MGEQSFLWGILYALKGIPATLGYARRMHFTRILYLLSAPVAIMRYVLCISLLMFPKRNRAFKAKVSGLHERGHNASRPRGRIKIGGGTRAYYFLPVPIAPSSPSTATSIQPSAKKETAVTFMQTQPRVFRDLQRRDALEALIRLRQIHGSTLTPTTPTKSFPCDNVVGHFNEHGQLALRTVPKSNIERNSAAPNQVFIGANPVEIGSNEDMTYFLGEDGEVKGSLTIDHRTLGLIGIPSSSEPSYCTLDTRYVDAADILLLLHHSVKTRASLILRPFLFDGSFASTNPALRAGDWILHAVCTDEKGGVAVWLDAKVIPAAVV